MRAALLVLVFSLGCGSTPAKRPPAPPISNVSLHSCGEAAQRVEDATRPLRDAEQSVRHAVVQQCNDAHWPEAAIDCFAEMTPDDLGACAGKLDDSQRQALFAAFGDSVAVQIAKLRQLEVGVPECQSFVTSVIAILSCERLPFASRVELGNKTADFWSLPPKLPPAAQAKMAAVCKQSLAELRGQVGDSGCMP